MVLFSAGYGTGNPHKLSDSSYFLIFRNDKIFDFKIKVYFR